MIPQPADAARERERNVLAHRSLHEERFGAIGGDVDDAGADRIGRVPERDLLAVDVELATGGPFRAGEDVEQLVLALALEGNDAEHLAGPHLERHVVELGGLEIADRQASRSLVGAPRVTLGDSRGLLRDFAEHELDDALLGALIDVDDADGDALAEDGGAVADEPDLAHPMGDEDDGARSPTHAGDRLEDALAQVRWQCGGHLVEQQDVRLDGEGAREVDDAE